MIKILLKKLLINKYFDIRKYKIYSFTKYLLIKYISYFKIILYYVFRIFPVQNNKIFIQNFLGKGYGDNPKYIVEEILRRELNYILVWAVKPEFSKELPGIIKTVRFNGILSIYEEVTAKIWIDNCRKESYVRKRKEQYYVQTWHGVISLKKVEKDCEQKLPAHYIKRAKHDSALANLFISDSKFTSDLYRTAFWYNGEILECGSPRYDILIKSNQNIKDKVRKYFHLTDKTRIILYAPTFRDTFSPDVYNINYELILNNLEKHTNEAWVFLTRMHPNISNKSNFIEYNEKVFNANNYNDIQELLLASDMLITDYSTCINEFAFMNKPGFLYISDYEQYKKERDSYFDLLSLPFPCAYNNSELIQKMINLNNEIYLNSLKEYFIKVGVVKDGNASQKVVNRIIMKINKYVLPQMTICL
jgi:CDP-glycerol glycerophosphotransferase